MAKFSSLNGTSCDNVTSVNGTAKASVNNVNGLETCSSGHDPGPAASKFYVGFANGDLSSDDSSAINKTDLVANTFSAYPSFNSETNRIAYGKDGSGNPLIILLTSADEDSLHRITPANYAAGTTNSATNITSVGVKQHNVAWGNDVWISVGDQKTTGTSPTKKIFRSTDGTNWTTIDISSLTDFPNVAAKIHALATNGVGKWWFGHYDNTTTTSRIYCSEDDGQTWALHHTLTTSQIYRMVYTNDTLVVTYNYAPGDGTGGRQAISAAGSATSGASNWGTPVWLNTNGNSARDTDTMIATSHGEELTNCIAAANGRVVVTDNQNALLLIVDGKTITVSGARTAIVGSVTNFNSNITSVVTDGAGNWYIGSTGAATGNGGDIAKNLNNADPASWTNGPTNLGVNRKIHSLAFNRYLPL